MLVETKQCIYEIKFNLIQIELTGYCNMNCKHCRAKEEPKTFFEDDNYNLLLELIDQEKGEDFKLTFSGGEPFLHPKLYEFIYKAKKHNIENIVVTSNGSLVTDQFLQKVDNLKFKNFIIQVSLDSLDPSVHDDFRGYDGAFSKCDKLLDKLKQFDNLHSSIRMTITRDTIDDMENMVKYAISKKCSIIGFGSVIPFGKASNGILSLNAKEKEIFLKKIIELNLKYQNEIEVVTEDPLKSIIPNSPWSIINCNYNDCVFGGCTAGIDSINIQSNGNITPCSMISVSILNLNNCKYIKDFIVNYQNNILVKKLLERKFDGKCNKCKFKYLCGGCRASAKGRTGSLFGSDESCWLENEKI